MNSRAGADSCAAHATSKAGLSVPISSTDESQHICIQSAISDPTSFTICWALIWSATLKRTAADQAPAAKENSSQDTAIS